MSGSGKTALARNIYDKLKPSHNNLVLIDGDIVRDIMNNDLGHTVEDRYKNAHRITRLCYHLQLQGLHVLCAVLSIFHESQDWNRKNVKDYLEAYIEIDFDTLVKRDPKGLYRQALNGQIKNVVGVDIDFPPPVNPDILIRNNGDIDKLYKEADRVIDHIEPLIKG